MIISNIRQTAKDGIRELSADVLFEQDNAEELLFIRCPDKGEANPCPADSFFVALMLPAMALGERLQIEAPVSSDIFAAVMENTVPLMREWFPQLHAAETELQTGNPAAPANGATASMFSGGVDSWHTLVERRDEIDCLVHIYGWEIPQKNASLWKAAHAIVQEIGHQFSVDVVAVSSNILETIVARVMEKPELNWRDFGIDAWYGHMLCAAGLALRPSISFMLIPSSFLPGVQKVASGTMIEPSLSIDSMHFSIAGAGSNRVNKIDLLVREYPRFVDWLRVCVDKRFVPENNILNCGRCVKCLRTQVELRVCAANVTNELFRIPLDMRTCMELKPSPASRPVWEALAGEARQRGQAQIYKTVRIMLDQSEWQRKLRRFVRRLKQRLAGNS